MFRKGVDIEWLIASLLKTKIFRSLLKVKVISRKCVSLMFVSIMIESPSSLSRFRPFALFIAASPLSLCKPTLLLSLTVLIIDSSKV